MEKKKRRHGDRKDGVLLRDLDPMHFIMPQLLPNRCDNEAYIAERIDLGPVNDYLAKKNAEPSDFPYTMFHLIVAAIVKTIILRPKLNRFIANKNVYQRNEVTAAFVVKKLFTDNGEEALAVLHAEDGDTLDTFHEKIYRQVSSCRSEELDASSNNMDILNKMPRFLSKFLVWIIARLDVHGWVPNFLIETDPQYASCFLSNIGSIKLKSGYHHLTNWGTCSLFCVVGEKKKTPVFFDDGRFELRETLDLGLTVDERIADGYYYSKSIKLFRYLLAHPQELEKPLSEPVDY